MILSGELNQLNNAAPGLGGGILPLCGGLRKFPWGSPREPGKRKYPGEEEPWQISCCFCSPSESIFLFVT